MTDPKQNDGQNVQPVRILRDRTVIDDMEAVTGWAAINDDASGLALVTTNILGAGALEYDKVNGTANTIIGGIEKTISPAVDLSAFLADDILSTAVFLSSIANVASISIRLGTDASNYSVWTIDDSALTGGIWEVIEVALSTVVNADQVGNGHDMSAISYAAVLVTFDLETDALANILWDHLQIHVAP